MARPIDCEIAKKRLQAWIDESEAQGFEEAARDFRDCISLLDAMPTLTPPNEPLTLEELSLFNAPVWIKRIDDEDLSGDGWAIVEGPRCLTWHNRIPVSWEIRVWWPGSEVEDFPKYENYRKTWLAYRRPPEGEEKNVCN